MAIMLVWSLLRTGATEIKTKLFSHPTLRGRKTSHPDHDTQSTCQHSRSAQCLPPLTPLPPAGRAPCCQPASLAMTSSPLRAPSSLFRSPTFPLPQGSSISPSQRIASSPTDLQFFHGLQVRDAASPEGSLPKTWRELPDSPHMQSLVSQSAL